MLLTPREAETLLAILGHGPSLPMTLNEHEAVTQAIIKKVLHDIAPKAKAPDSINAQVEWEKENGVKRYTNPMPAAGVTRSNILDARREPRLERIRREVAKIDAQRMLDLGAAELLGELGL